MVLRENNSKDSKFTKMMKYPYHLAVRLKEELYLSRAQALQILPIILNKPEKLLRIIERSEATTMIMRKEDQLVAV